MPNNPGDKQILSSSYDTDTGILDIHLFTGEHYYVTNAGHARKIKEKISPGGRLNTSQVSFLARYLVPSRGQVTAENRAKLRSRIGKLREELRGKNLD